MKANKKIDSIGVYVKAQGTWDDASIGVEDWLIIDNAY